MTFEDFLVDKYTEDYLEARTKCDEFDDWLADLDINKLLKYGDLFAIQVLKGGK